MRPPSFALLLATLGFHAAASAHIAPVADQYRDLIGFLRMPHWADWNQPAVITAAVTIAFVASLETLLNLEAIDKIDPRQRTSLPNLELLAQGVGNMACGLTGGLPIT